MRDRDIQEKEYIKSIINEGENMGPSTKLLWEITYKSGYTMGNLYFFCHEDDIEFMFKQIQIRDFMQPIELFSYRMLGECIDFEDLIAQKDAECERRVDEATKNYIELLMAVGNKYPGENRHETALRYIRQAEQSSDVASEATTQPKDQHAN